MLHEAGFPIGEEVQVSGKLSPGSLAALDSHIRKFNAKIKDRIIQLRIKIRGSTRTKDRTVYLVVELNPSVVDR